MVSKICTDQAVVVHGTTIVPVEQSGSDRVVGYVVEGHEDELMSLQQAIDFGIGEYKEATGEWSL